MFKIFMRFVRFVILICLNLLYKIEIEGYKNFPKKGGAIVCANHLGNLDMFFIGYKIKRLVHWMAKEELFNNKIFAMILRKIGAFPVKRGTGDLGAIKFAINLIKNEHILGIFPEGTRTIKKNSEEIKLKSGVALIAIKTGVPIIPVAIDRDCKIFGKVRIIFGNPINIVKDKGNTKLKSEQLAKISQDIMDSVYNLLR